MKYNLIHVLSDQELYTPLVLSQVFEQAVSQQQISGTEKPSKVEIWIPIPVRFLFLSRFRKHKKYLKNRFGNIKIRFFPGINRLKGFPIKNQLLVNRKKLEDTPCIFHFRGDTLLQDFWFLKTKYNKDRFVADIRGIWPAEKLLLDGVEVWKSSEIDKYPIAQSLVDNLSKNLTFADAVTTVSPNLKSWIGELDKGNKPVWVVPCSVKFSSDFAGDEMSKEEMLPRTTYTLGYLGGTAPYQNLEDMVLPLFKKLVGLDSNIRLIFITHQPDKMLSLIQQAAINKNRFQIVSVSQELVRKELGKLDLGFLIRKPNLVNSMAQPVKLGEYLGAGVPVCIEGDLGGMNFNSEAILSVSLLHKGVENAANKILDFLKHTDRRERKEKALMAAKDYFSWDKNIMIHRSNYIKVLNRF